jgi:3-hydroxyacyl-[acyl-carrier-protein] dehydratase
MTDVHGLDIEAIIERLPHRFPFLLVDRVLSVTPGQSIVALKNVTVNEAHFVGHFPRHPVMPGVLVLEALAQAGGVLAWESAKNAPAASVPEESILYLVGIENARFKLPVRPGDQLVLRADLTKFKRGLWRFHCRAEVGEKLAVEADIMMATGNAP